MIPEQFNIDFDIEIDKSQLWSKKTKNHLFFAHYSGDFAPKELYLEFKIHILRENSCWYDLTLKNEYRLKPQY